MSSTPKKRKALVIQIIYIIAVILWILVIYGLGIHRLHLSRVSLAVSYLILSIPIFVFALGFLSVNKVDEEFHKKVCKRDLLPIAILFIAALLNGGDKDLLTIKILLVASVLVVLGLVDIWTGTSSMKLISVVRSICQTAAITLLVYVLYHRFMMRMLSM